MTQQSFSSMNINVNNLGYFLDGWADLIEGMGSKANTILPDVIKGLQERNMPEISVNPVGGTVSTLSNNRRPYIITSTAPGATTAIYICPHGKDLYASWRTFIKPVFYWSFIFVMLIIAVVLAIFYSGVVNGFNTRYTFPIIGLVSPTILFFLFEVIALTLAGKIWKGSFLAFFFIEPTIFDADDITAMSLSVHKTIIRALDSSGIDISKLRLKQNFKGGRRDEMV